MRLTFDVLQFHLLFGYDCALVIGYPETSNNKTLSCRNFGNELSCYEKRNTETKGCRNLNNQTGDSY